MITILVSNDMYFVNLAHLVHILPQLEVNRHVLNVKPDHFLPDQHLFVQIVQQVIIQHNQDKMLVQNVKVVGHHYQDQLIVSSTLHHRQLSCLQKQ